MALRDNVSGHNRLFILNKILSKMGIKAPGKGRTRVGATAGTGARQIALLQKAGVPATNTEADAPTGLGDLCYDTTNEDVYRCSAFTDTTTFTWTKIVD